MSSNNNNKEIKVGIETKYKRKVAKLEASLKEKSKLEKTYLNQLRYARARANFFRKLDIKRLNSTPIFTQASSREHRLVS